jgi:ethanolamine phosphate phosphodiesterase
VFSAHAHRFSDIIHADGTREIIVPAMTWATNEKPGFVFVTFGQNSAISVSHCILAQEWHVLAYDFFLLLSLLAVALVVHRETFRK